MPVVVVLELDGRDGADLAVQASVVEPVDVCAASASRVSKIITAIGDDRVQRGLEDLGQPDGPRTDSGGLGRMT